MGKQKKGRQLKAERESELIEDFINSNMDRIIKYGALRLNLDPATLTEADKQRIHDSFVASYNDYKFDKQYNHRALYLNWTIKDTKESLLKTFKSDLFNTKEMRDVQQLIDNLKHDGVWETFRTLNRHQKLDLTAFERLAPSGDPHVKAEWIYHGHFTIKITLYYTVFGTYYWSAKRV